MIACLGTVEVGEGDMGISIIVQKGKGLHCHLSWTIYYVPILLWLYETVD